MNTLCRQRMMVSIALAVAATTGCAVEVGDGEVDSNRELIAVTEQPLSTALGVDFSDYALGPLGSPWSVTRSGSGTSNVVSTTDHGRALRIAHSAERDYSLSQIALPPTAPALQFDFAVKPRSSASTFTVTLKGPKSGYKIPKFALSLVPGSNALTVTSIGAGPSCGTLPYGRWSTVNGRLVDDGTGTGRRVMNVRVNGVLSACTGVTTSLRSANMLQVIDNEQPSANAETLFDDFLVQSE